MSRLSVPSSSDPREGRRFLSELEGRLEKLDRAILVAEWDLFTGRSAVGAERWNLERSALLSDDRLLAWVRSSLRRGGPPLLGRKLELLRRVLLDAQVEQHSSVVRLRSKLQRRIAEFRPRWKGRRVDRAVLHRTLREDPDGEERRRAFCALEELHRPLEAPLRSLLRLRNERARALGFRSFAEMRLGFDGITPDQLEALAQQVVAPARAQVRRLRERFQERTGQSGWHPWDLPFAQEQRVPLPDRYFPRGPMLRRIFRAVAQWGFRTDRMRFHVVFHDVPTGGLTLAPDPPKDVRILVHPQSGWSAYMVMFHEVGHAVHSALIRAPRHLLRWHENIPGFGPFHEGIGGLFEQIASEEAWLASVPGLGPRRAHAFAEATREDDAVNAGWHANWMRTEQALYRNPEGDPWSEVRRYEQRVFGYDGYAPLSFVDTFFVDSPLYSPCYLLAILFGCQVQERMREVCGEPFWPNPKVGPWLRREWFAGGSRYDWVPRVRELTGRPFGAGAFLRKFRHLSASG